MAPAVPSLVRERAAWGGGRLLIGVDEAGRGPLAGPVVAAAVVFSPAADPIPGVRDSKTLSEPRRLSLAGAIRARAEGLGIGAASCREIERFNIRLATVLAMRRAVARLLPQLGDRPHTCLVDGLAVPELGFPHEALVDGDALCYSVAAAGIIAKTVRDRLMSRLGARYPAYQWDRNRGYGTPAHLGALARFGPTPHHRRDFGAVRQLALGVVR